MNGLDRCEAVAFCFVTLLNSYAGRTTGQAHAVEAGFCPIAELTVIAVAVLIADTRSGIDIANEIRIFTDDAVMDTFTVEAAIYRAGILVIAVGRRRALLKEESSSGRRIRRLLGAGC
ncbi:MAG: hypothetical protein O7D91_13820 [Planctomycetota bacterium]|nr:hypothetical protein [Planctomycetota bacterium]